MPARASVDLAINAVCQGPGIWHRDVNRAVPSDHAADLLQGALEPHEVFQSMVQDHRVEGSGWKRKSGGVGLNGGRLAFFVLEIHSDDYQVRIGVGRKAPTAGAEIEHTCTFRQMI